MARGQTLAFAYELYVLQHVWLPETLVYGSCQHGPPETTCIPSRLTPSSVPFIEARHHM
jgi:hypothetical protein